MERVHQTLGNMIRAYELEKFEFDCNDPWTQILSNCTWAIRSTALSILDDIPAQILLGGNMVFDLSLTTSSKDLLDEKTKSF